MKTSERFVSLRMLTSAAVAGALLLGGASLRASQVVANNFDAASEVSTYSVATWADPAVLSFSALDAGGSVSSSGSMKIINNFPDRGSTGFDSTYIGGVFANGPFNAAALYSTISLDIKVDPASYPRTGGADYGTFTLYLVNGTSWTSLNLGAVTLTSTNWTHVSFNVPATANAVHRSTLQFSGNGLTNTVICYVDNLRWNLRSEVAAFNFDTTSEVNSFSVAGWADPANLSFSSLDAGGSVPTSGSMQVDNYFPNRVPDGWGQCAIGGVFGSTMDAATLFSKISFDIKVDPSSSMRTNGADYGQFTFYLVNGSAWTWLTAGTLYLTNTGWAHVSFDVPSTANAVHRLTLELKGYGLTNSVTYYIDNIRWLARETPVAPPTLTLERTDPGLNLVAGSSGEYDRQGIATVNSSYGWVGASDPVSYSLTISKFPDAAAHPEYAATMYLVPGSPTDSEPDWDDPTVVLVSVATTTNGLATMEFHYKSNAPGGHGQLYNADPANGPVGFLGTLTTSNILGTWTVTFAQDTHITLTAPNHASTNFYMPADDAALFGGGLTVYYGIVPHARGIGEKAVLSGVQIQSGSNTLLEDHFSVAPLDATLWNVRAVSASSVSIVATNQPYYVWWTTPATGFNLQTNASLSGGGWGSLGLTPESVGGKLRVTLPSAALPSAGQGFFRLVK